MKHTIEELGDYADEHHDGKFYIWKDSENSKPNKPWGFQFGSRGENQYHGATPDEAVDAAIEANERARSGNYLVTFDGHDLVKTEDERRDRVYVAREMALRAVNRMIRQFNPPLVDRGKL